MCIDVLTEDKAKSLRTSKTALQTSNGRLYASMTRHNSIIIKIKKEKIQF